MISIIIVSYNACELLKKCVDSILEHINVQYELIIVDNASGLETKKYLECLTGKVKVIFNEKNIGFAKANNIGAKVARGKVIHFLNPDTVVDSNLNSLYVAMLKDSNHICVTGLIEGKSITSVGYVMPLFVNVLKIVTKQKLIKWYIGASILISKRNFEIIKGWSEDYFMYSEDLDLCYKAYKKGINIIESDVKIYHLGGGTSKTVWDKTLTDIKKEISYLKFIKKYKLYINYVVFSLLGCMYDYFKYKEYDLIYIAKIKIKALKRFCFDDENLW